MREPKLIITQGRVGFCRNNLEQIKNKVMSENTNENCIKGYHRSSKAFYAKQLGGEIRVSFGMYDNKDGSTSGEMMMEWIELSGNLYTKLETYEDSWGVLASFSDVIQKMGEVNGQLISEDVFCKLLDECGFKDLTRYVNPDSTKEEMISVTIPKSKAVELGLIQSQLNQKLCFKKE